jgi:hypothetical protein
MVRSLHKLLLGQLQQRFYARTDHLWWYLFNIFIFEESLVCSNMVLYLLPLNDTKKLR